MKINMELLNFYTLALVCILPMVQALQCITCSGSSFEECDANSEITRCLINQKSCETVVRRYKDIIHVWKGCKDRMACNNNQMQNRAYSGQTAQCNSDQTNSACTCCCDGDMCNAGASCMGDYHLKRPVSDCPAPPATLPHGGVSCSKQGEAGSVCQYQCTEKDYSVWPEGHETNICLGNGTWEHEHPCCARPCPPYFLVESAVLVHFTGPNANRLLESFKTRIVYGKVAEDGLKQAFLSFGSEVVESSVIRFNEYNASETRLRQLMDERLVVTEVPGKTGLALQYALDNLFRAEFGMRDDRVPRSIVIHQNTQPDDDVIEVAARARELGYQMYFFGIQLDGFKFDREQLMRITGEEDHVFVFDNFYGRWELNKLMDMINHFCFNPCDHVLHDH